MLLAAHAAASSALPPTNHKSGELLPDIPAEYRDRDLRPRLIVSADCSGSSFIVGAVGGLLQAHGLHIVKGGVYANGTVIGDSEMINLEKNPYLPANNGTGLDIELGPDGDLAKSMDELIRRTQARGFAPLIKTTTAPGDGVLEVFKKYETQAVVALRDNALDRLICEVRDCFRQSGVGKVVNVTSGAPSSVCFERRELPHAEQAHLRVHLSAHPGGFSQAIRSELLSNSLPPRLKALTKLADREVVAVLRGVLAYEDLAAYQWDASAARGSSREAWHRLLAALGFGWPVRTGSGSNFSTKYAARVNESLLDQFLANGAGSAHAPGPTAAELINPGEVRRAVHAEKDLAWMWRD